MFRFLSLVWDELNPEACSAATLIASRLRGKNAVWHCAVDEGGFRVFVASSVPICDRVHVLRKNSSVVLGSVFSRSIDSRTPQRNAKGIDRFSANEADLIIATRGRRLVDAFWGSYVAFIRDVSNGTCNVLRSPRGFVPCFGTTFRGVFLFFSRVEDCASLELIRFSVNWERIVSHAVDGTISSTRTAVNEITEMPGGDCVEVSRGGVIRRQSYWDPFAIAAEAPLEKRHEAVELARSTVKSCARALASEHDVIIHSLSGGIDSSVVLGSFSQDPSAAQIVCLNYHTAGSNGDERYYARLAADQARRELVESPRPLNISFLRILDMVRTAAPSVYVLELVSMEPAKELARERGATAVSTGVQGDAVFYRHPAYPAAADYVLAHGIRPGLFKVSLDVARLERFSVWKVLGHALRSGLIHRAESYASIRKSMYQANPGRGAVSKEVALARHSQDSSIDPQLRAMRRLPPGKLWQVFEMSFGSYEDPFSRPDDPVMISPLASQPVAELCLRVPTYVHLNDGWDRSIAREAFVDDVPEQILRRTTKGGMDEHVKALLSRNLKFVRETLLNGSLVRNRVLVKEIVESALSGRPTSDTVYPAQLLMYLGVELWLNSWAYSKCEAAA